MDSSPSPSSIQAGAGENNPGVRRSPRRANIADTRSLPSSSSEGSFGSSLGGAAAGRGVAATGRGVAAAGRGLAGGRIAAAARWQAARGRGNSRGAGRRFTKTELENLNEVISQLLPIGGEEWEEVANLHSQQYPEHQRDAVNLRRKFKEMYNARIPTGDPECPEHIKTAKRLHIQIQQRSDADNMDGNGLDMGVEEEEVDDDNNIEERTEEAPEDDQTPRRLFDGAAPRPLVRTPVSVVGRGRQTGNSDVAAAVLAHMNQSQRNEQVDREELRRRERLDQEDRRMNQLFMIGLLTAMNPGAAAAMQPIQHQLLRNMANDESNNDNESNNESNNSSSNPN